MAAASSIHTTSLSLKKMAEECYTSGVDFQEKYESFHLCHKEVDGIKEEFESQVLTFVKANSALARDAFENQIGESYSVKTAKKVRALLKDLHIDTKLQERKISFPKSLMGCELKVLLKDFLLDTQLPTQAIEVSASLIESAKNYSQLFERLEIDEAYQAYRTAKKAFKKVVIHYLNMGIGNSSITGYIRRTALKDGVDSSKMIEKIYQWNRKRERPLRSDMFAI